MTNIIYLDNNATTKVDERVAEKMLPYFCKYYGNPSSMHDFGGNVKHAVDEARAQIAEFMGANTEREIIRDNNDLNVISTEQRRIESKL